MPNPFSSLQWSKSQELKCSVQNALNFFFFFYFSNVILLQGEVCSPPGTFSLRKRGAEFAALLSDYGKTSESNWTDSSGLLGTPRAHFSVRTSRVLQAWVLQRVADGSASKRPDVSEMASLDGSDCKDLNWTRGDCSFLTSKHRATFRRHLLSSTSPS